MTRVRRRATFRQWGLVAALGAVLVIAGLLPPLTARGDATTELTGSVVSSGNPVVGITVGFWSPSDGVVKHTTTNASGRFTLDVPFSEEGYAYAGTAPDDSTAIATVHGTRYVRGVISTTKRSGVSSPLYQGYTAGTGRGLNGGANLDFVLQQPGRIAGTSSVLESGSGSVRLERLDGSVVQTFQSSSAGAYTSKWLVPGNYQVAVLPDAPQIAQRTRVTVASGATAAVSPMPLERGATVRGVVESNGSAIRSAVPIVVRQSGVQVAVTTSRANGAYSVTGLAAGTYQITFGRYADTVDASGRVLERSHRTSSDYLPATVTVTVDALLDDVQQDVSLEAAGHITGTVSGAAGEGVDVLLEDPSTGTVLHATTANSSTGAFSIGGLEPGTSFAVYAVNRTTDATAARYGTVTTTAETSPATVKIALTLQAPTISGNVSGASSASVQAGDTAVFTRSAVVSNGKYQLTSLVPGSWSLTVSDGDRADADPVQVTIAAGTTSTSQDLSVGPSFATYRAWFISNGAGVSRISGLAVASSGAVVRIGPVTDRGYVTVTGLAPGTYHYLSSSFVGNAPADDGPWWFDPPTGSFTLRGGQTTDVGPIVLRARATLG